MNTGEGKAVPGKVSPPRPELGRALTGSTQDREGSCLIPLPWDALTELASLQVGPRDSPTS